MTRRRLIILAVSLVLALVFLASQAKASTPQRAIVIGDSIAQQAQTPYGLTFGVVTSTTYTATWGYALRDQWQALIAAFQTPASTPVVLALGGNDAMQHGQVTYDPIPGWQKVLDGFAAQGRCVVIPDLERSRGPMVAERQAFWSRLTALLVNYPTVHVARWQDIAQQHDDWYLADQLHHTETGNLAYAWALGIGLQSCR